MDKIEYRSISKHVAVKIEPMKFRSTEHYWVTECRQNDKGEYIEVCTGDKMRMFSSRSAVDDYIEELKLVYSDKYGKE